MRNSELTQSQLIDLMHHAGVRPSLQRVATLESIHRLGHPSAEEIYASLAPSLPRLSRTTVYNSVHALVEAGLVRELDIESGTVHYDLAPQPRHSHFMCRQCGRIFDMPMPSGVLPDTGNGFMIDSIELYIKGICPQCNNRHNNN